MSSSRYNHRSSIMLTTVVIIGLIGATIGQPICTNSQSAQKYKIKGGETLRSVAQSSGLPLQAILAANPQLTHPSKVPYATIHVPCGKRRKRTFDMVGVDQDIAYKAPPFTVQAIMSAPASTCEVMHVTAADLTDTCDSITERYGLPVATLEDLNPGLEIATLCSNVHLPAGLKVCVHNITMDEYQMADNLQYINETTSTTYGAYSQAPNKEAMRLEFWRSMRDTILTPEGTNYMRQLSTFNAGDVRAMQSRMSSERDQECNEMRSKGGVPKDVVDCYCSTEEYMICAAKLQAFMDSDAIQAPAPAGSQAISSNQTTMMTTSSVPLYSTGPLTVQAAIKGYICNPSVLQVNADKLLMWYFADKSLSYSTTDAIDQALGTYTGLTIDLCLKFKELSQFLSKYLGIDVCLGAEFKQYPVQQMTANGVFVQVFFLKLWAGGKSPINVPSSGTSNSVSWLCNNDKFKGKYTCEDYCQVHIQQKERIYSAEVSMKVLWWTKKLWKKNWGLDKCVRPSANSIINSPYSSDSASNYATTGAWEPLILKQAQADRIKAGQATIQSIIQAEYANVGGVYTRGNNANYPGCGSALQCKKR